MTERVQGEVRVPVNLGGLNYMVTPAQAESLAQEGWLAADDDSLDAAWAEAEAALPEGIGLALYQLALPGWAEAVAGDLGVSAPTPAAALRALAAKLRNPQEGMR